MTASLLLLTIGGLGPTGALRRQSVRSSEPPPLGVATLLHAGDFLYVSVSLGGRPPQRFILDTGSYRSYVTKRGLARLKASGLVPRKDGETVPLPASVGGLVLGVASFALDTTGFPAPLDPESDGIVGLDLLARNRIGIDVAKVQFRAWPASVPTKRAAFDWYGSPSPGVRSTDLWGNGDGTYVATAELANLSLPMCVDTGCAESYLSRELAPALRPNVRVGTSEATFYTGVERVDTYRVTRFGIEGMPLPAQRIGATWSPNVSGILGVDVLEKLRLLLDFPERCLRYAASGTTPAATKRTIMEGPRVDLPTGVTIRWPLGEVVRVEPGCTYRAPNSYRKVRRPDGTLDLVPPGTKLPAFRPRPRLLLAPTVDGAVFWVDRPAHVPPKSRYTVPPGWRRVKRSDGSLDLYPPASARRSEGHAVRSLRDLGSAR